MNVNTLTKAALFIIFKDGRICILPKEEGKEYHIEYLEKILEENEYLKQILSKENIEIVKDNPAQFQNEISHKLIKEGHAIFLNLGCNYYGPTNCFIGYLPNKLTDLQKNILYELEEDLNEVEMFSLGMYNSNGEIDEYDEYPNIIEFVTKNSETRKL